MNLIANHFTAIDLEQEKGARVAIKLAQTAGSAELMRKWNNNDQQAN